MIIYVYVCVCIYIYIYIYLSIYIYIYMYIIDSLGPQPCATPSPHAPPARPSAEVSPGLNTLRAYTIYKHNIRIHCTISLSLYIYRYIDR